MCKGKIMEKIPEILLEKLSKAEHVVILTGAGVSAESGIKTFRDPDGLWSKFDPTELASVDGFISNTELVWEWYQYRVDIVNNAKPNPGHKAIAEMEKIFPKLTVITQNVDRLHQRAGSENILELHGNIVENHCFDCKIPFDGKTDLPDKQLPKCPECDGRIRPNVVWFGEMLPEEALSGAQMATAQCDVFFTIGTSGQVYPAAHLPVQAKQYGAYIVEVNPEPTPLSNHHDLCLQESSGVAMPAVLKALKEYTESQK
jgi:NAD-dependent protein deacetylase/lipoamidase